MSRVIYYRADTSLKTLSHSCVESLFAAICLDVVDNGSVKGRVIHPPRTQWSHLHRPLPPARRIPSCGRHRDRIRRSPSCSCPAKALRPQYVVCVHFANLVILTTNPHYVPDFSHL